MRLHLISLSLVIMLSACQGNTSTDDLELTPIGKKPEPTVPEPTVPEPTVPEPTVPEPTVPEPTVPEPVCIASHSADEPAIAANSSTHFVFFPSFSNGKLQSFELAASTPSDTLGSGFSTAQTPFSHITGTNLLTKKMINNGQWLLEPRRLLFSDTLAGGVKQISNLDVNGSRVCSIDQVKPSFSRMSEFYINYGSSCSLNVKVNLAMSSTDSAVKVPNSAVAKGVSIYDAGANWLGQLHKVTAQGKAKLVFQKPNYCSQKKLFDFADDSNSWSAEQYSDGSLLLRIEEKIYYLNPTDVALLVADDSNYNLPDTPLITVSSASQNIWMGKNSKEIYYTNVLLDENVPANNKVELLVYDIAAQTTASPISLYSAGDSAKTVIGLDKVVLDENSVWIETRYTTLVSDVKHYHRRYSRWNNGNVGGKGLDAIAQFDYELKVKDQVSKWHSIGNKVYLKVNERTGLFQAVATNGEQDYLLQAGNAALNAKKVWHFIKQGSMPRKQADSIIAWNYTNHGANQYTAEIIDANTSTPFPSITRNIQALAMGAQYSNLTLFWDLSCTSGCTSADSIAQIEYRVSALKHSDNSINILRHETCQVIKETEDPKVPQSQTCTVN